MNLTYLKYKGKVKGFFSPDIPYYPLLESGDSSPYFGHYEGQRYGRFDTSCCWDFAACEIIETRLTMLEAMGLIPADTLQWAKDKGYKDADGDWYISRRWVAILSGVRDSGNNHMNFWNIASVSGVIPNSMLPYSDQDAFDEYSQSDFNNEYFDKSKITPEMVALGKEFVKRFDIRAQDLRGGFFKDISTTLQTYLKEGSMQIGHPVPYDGSWNQVYVKAPTDHYNADHSTELYKFDPSANFPFYDYDSYEPHRKFLSKDTFIVMLTRIVIRPKQIVTPVTLPQFSTWMQFWFNAKAFLLGDPLPFPDVQIGRI